MTSREFEQKRYLQRPEATRNITPKPSFNPWSSPVAHPRDFTVYDAVAGRVSSRQDGSFFRVKPTDAEPGQGKPRYTKHSTKNTVLAPEEVLYRRESAPQRWPDHDAYMAHERELANGGDGVLPSSDLLTAIHLFSSYFYETLGRRHPSHLVDGRNINNRSLDETALLSFGILLEEAAKETLGEDGHLVFVEGELIGDEPRRNAPPTSLLPAPDSDLGHRQKKTKVEESND